MKRILLHALCLACGVSSLSAALPRPFSTDADPFRYARHSHQAASAAGWQALPERAVSGATPASSVTSDEITLLTAPDGSIWYASCEYETEEVTLEGGYATEEYITAYTITVYNSDFTEVGSVHDVVTLGEGESRVADLLISDVVTQKFYNTNTNYEISVSIVYNKTSLDSYPYTNTRTEIYSLGGDKDDDGNDVSIQTIDGYPIDAVNAATDSWSETFYISYLTETAGNESDYDTYLEYLATIKSVVTTYKKASYNTQPSVLYTYEVPQICLPGDAMSYPFYITDVVDGKLTITTAEYEKSFFVDPTGMSEDESVTADNNLIIKVRQLGTGYGATLQDVSTTSIPTTQSTDADVLCTFYAIGALRYEGDIDFEHYTTDGTPAFVVVTANYSNSNDETYSNSYYVYDSEGQKLLTLAENVDATLVLSDIEGEEPQALFAYAQDDSNYTYNFVDLYSGTTKFTMSSSLDGKVVSTSMDRVLTKDGILYASSLTGAYDDADGNTISEIGWINTDGAFDHIDKINLGTSIAYGQVYISQAALSPYMFNTDTNQEYMFLVKRYLDSENTTTQEELLVLAPESDPILQITPDETKGNLLSIGLLTGTDNKLGVIYKDDDYRYTFDLFNLPLTMFAGGTGTVEDPYQIATVGDLQQVKSYPAANYIVVADIDASGFDFTTIDSFTGVIDGNSKTISNMSISGRGIFKETSGATIKNLTFTDATIKPQTTYSQTGLLIGSAQSTTVTGINVYGLSIDNASFDDSFGSLVGYACLNTEISLCQVGGANINLPSGLVGGIVGSMYTGATVKACAFTGTIVGSMSVGGIAGMIYNDGGIYDNHVDADITGENTIGGVVGESSRGEVARNHVEGTITGTDPSSWYGYCVGGIVGYLLPSYGSSSTTKVVNSNFVSIESITVDNTLLGEPDYEGALDTVHRIVGWSNANDVPEVTGYDDNWNPIYGDLCDPEESIENNYVLSSLEAVTAFDPEAHTTTEGLAMSRWSLEEEFMEGLGYKFGEDVDNPWNLTSIYDPALYFEQSLLLQTATIDTTEGETFNIEVRIIDREQLTLSDVLGDFTMSYDETIMSMTGSATVEDNVLSIEMLANAAGTGTFTIGISGTTVQGTVNVAAYDGLKNTIADKSFAISYDGQTVAAQGCTIELFSITGAKVAAANDAISIADLTAGVYVVRATDGTTTRTAKIAVK